MKRKRLVRNEIVGLLLLIVCAYVLYPQIVMLSGSLSANGKFSIERYVALFDLRNGANLEAVSNSLILSALSVLFSAIVGGLFAFTFTQTRFPFSRICSRLAVLPIALPPLVGVIAFLFVFGESGFLPRILQKVLMLQSVPFYLEGFNAVVAVHVYSFYVYFYLFISTSLRQLDGSQIEAAASLGSSSWNTFRRVILPELRPGIVGASLLTFMTSMASFSAPLIFGGEHRFLTTQIYSTKLNGEMETAAAQSMLLTLISVGFFLVLTLTWKSPAGGRRTKGSLRPAEIRFRPLARRVLIALTVVLLLIEVLPILTLIVISFVKEGSWTWQLFPSSYTTENYSKLFLDPRVFDPIRNSIAMTGVAVLGGLVIGVMASFVLVKGGLKKGRVALDLLLSLSYAIPGTVIAIGLIYTFNRPTLPGGFTILVGTFWILPLAYFIRSYPLIIQSTSASLERLDDSLMEAGQALGAGVLRRSWGVALPLILPGIVAGCLLAAIMGLGEFVSSILLYTYASRPISIEILSQLRGYNFGAASAYSVFLLALILLLTTLSLRLTRRNEGDNAIGL